MACWVKASVLKQEHIIYRLHSNLISLPKVYCFLEVFLLAKNKSNCYYMWYKFWQELSSVFSAIVNHISRRFVLLKSTIYFIGW